MATLTGEILIDRAVDVVFDTVADERNEPLYNPAMVSAEKLTEGPIGAGTRFKAVHASRRRPIEMIVEFTDYDRPRHLASATTMSWGEVRGELTFHAVPAGTRMQWTWDIRPRGVAKLATPLVTAIGRRAERACWSGLKRYLEAGSPLAQVESVPPPSSSTTPTCADP